MPDDAGLERSLELPPVVLRFQDWPGTGRVLVFFGCAPPAGLAPRYRVIRIEPRAGVSAAGHAEDLAGFLKAFGFDAPIVAGGLPVVYAATWYPELVGGIVVDGAVDTSGVTCSVLTLDQLEAAS